MSELLNLHKFADTAMRIPPLFIMDEVLKGSLIVSPKVSKRFLLSVLRSKLATYGREESGEVIGMENRDRPYWYEHENNSSSPTEEMEFTSEGQLLMWIMGTFLFSATLLVLSSVVFLLSRQNLMRLYHFVFSFALIIFSFQVNMATVNLVLDLTQKFSQPAILQSLVSLNISELINCSDSAFYVFLNYVFQSLMGLIFINFLPPFFQQSVPRFLILITFIIPSCTLLSSLSVSLKYNISMFSALLPLVLMKFIFMKNLYNLVLVLRNGYDYASDMLENYGLETLLQTEWKRLDVPNVLRTFWLLRTAHHIVHLLGGHLYEHGDYSSLLDSSNLHSMFKEVMVVGCETTVALLGMTSIVSYIGHYIGLMFQTFLMVDENDRNMGTVCAVLFFILAEQSGLTSLDNDRRYARLGRNFSFLFTSILYFTHNMVNPILMSLSASRNPVTHRHIRALFVCFLLVLLPSVLIYFTVCWYVFSSWLVAVVTFAAQVIIKILVSLLIYSLFLLDACYNQFGEHIDDYVYYVQAFGNTVDFMFGILLFFIGTWIYLFEEGGKIRATMICIHAYFNIWCEAKNGWKVFMKRRTAVNKINSLPDASKKELEDHGDVCAICFQDLSSAKITRCRHLFHSICLRKWLYVQDSCPLCHETLYRIDNLNDKNLTHAAHQPPPAPVNSDVNSQNSEENSSQTPNSDNQIPSVDSNPETSNQSPHNEAENDQE